MSAFRVALLALLVASASVAALPTAATAGDAAEAAGDAAPPPATLDAAAAQNGTANNSSLGADISSFMQSNAAEVGGTVETGMWTAAYDATENRTVRTRLVERRTADLRTELTDLRERKQELLAEREAGNVSDAAYKARIGQIVGQIDALESAINATETRARAVDANVENVTRLRTETGQLAGPEIGTVARNLTGVGAGEHGPPSGVGNGTGVESDNGNGDGVGNGNGNDVGGNGNDLADAENGTTTAANGLGEVASAGNAPLVGERPEGGTAVGGPAAPSVSPPAAANETTTGGGPPEDGPAKLSTFTGAMGDLVGSVSDALGARW